MFVPDPVTGGVLDDLGVLAVIQARFAARTAIVPTAAG
jgi:hypothetical protein